MVDVGQLAEPVQRWFVRQRTGSETTAAPSLPDGVRIRRRKDHQVAACARLLGIVSSEHEYPLPRPASRRGWLTTQDVLDAWIAEQDGSVQGHVALTRVDADSTTALRWREVTGHPAADLAGVTQFFVRPSIRRRGLGTALLGSAVEEARARGLMPVAEVVSSSRQGVPYFDHAGWRMVEMYPSGKRGDGLEAYMYVAPR